MSSVLIAYQRVNLSELTSVNSSITPVMRGVTIAVLCLYSRPVPGSVSVTEMQVILLHFIYYYILYIITGLNTENPH